MTTRPLSCARFSAAPRRALVLVTTLVSGILASGGARAESGCFSAPWHHLGDTGSSFVRPVPLVLVGSAALAPAVMASANIDHDLRIVAQNDLGGRHNVESVSVLAPYVLGGGVLVGYVVSVAVSACSAERPQAAMLQAMALSLGSTVLLKYAVGREWPNAGLDPSDPERLEHSERARHFAPFGRFGSWPSGHASFLFAAASSFRTSTPELGVVSWLGYPFALGVAAGMWIGDHHWASDIVSGALFGEALGSSVGYGFAGDARRETTTFGVAPLTATIGAPSSKSGVRATGVVLYASGGW